MEMTVTGNTAEKGHANLLQTPESCIPNGFAVCCCGSQLIPELGSSHRYIWLRFCFFYITNYPQLYNTTSIIHICVDTSTRINHIRSTFNVDKLQDLGIADIFEAKIGSRFSDLNLLEDDINVLTDNMKKVFRKQPHRYSGRKGTRTNPGSLMTYWASVTKKGKKTKKTNHDAANHYNELNNNIIKKMKEAKDLERRIQAFEHTWYRRLLRMSSSDNNNNSVA